MSQEQTKVQYPEPGRRIYGVLIADWCIIIAGFGMSIFGLISLLYEPQLRIAVAVIFFFILLVSLGAGANYKEGRL